MCIRDSFVAERRVAHRLREDRHEVVEPRRHHPRGEDEAHEPDGVPHGDLPFVPAAAWQPILWVETRPTSRIVNGPRSRGRHDPSSKSVSFCATTVLSESTEP